MLTPNSSVTLTPQQVEDLNQKLSKMRHDINNHLSLIVFAVEVLRSKPEMLERMSATLSDQPQKITADLSKFSAEFEQTLGIIRT
jgi:chaperonin cofactor prefoldin